MNTNKTRIKEYVGLVSLSAAEIATEAIDALKKIMRFPDAFAGPQISMLDKRNL